MALDALVDSTLLDAACTYEAGKIREKLGSSAQIAYDLANGKGFGDAIAAIPTGGGGDTLEIDLTSAYQWEIGAVNGAVGNTYENSKTSNNARLRGVTLIKTNNIPFTFTANWDGWTAQYAKYNDQQKGASSFTVMTSDTELSPSPYIAVVLRHSNGTTAMNVSDVQIIKPKLTLDVENLGIVFGGE